MAIAQNWHTTKNLLNRAKYTPEPATFLKDRSLFVQGNSNDQTFGDFICLRTYVYVLGSWVTSHRTYISFFFWRIYTSLMCQSRVLRDLTIRQRRRQWKRRWKIAPASFQTISSTSYLKQGTLCWSWRERATPEFKQRWYNLSPCRSHLHVWSFHVAEQEMEKNVQKSVMHLLSLFSLSQVS